MMGSFVLPPMHEVVCFFVKSRAEPPRTPRKYGVEWDEVWLLMDQTFCAE